MRRSAFPNLIAAALAVGLVVLVVTYKMGDDGTSIQSDQATQWLQEMAAREAAWDQHMVVEANKEKPLPPKKLGPRRSKITETPHNTDRTGLNRQPTPTTATAGAYEAEEALFDQCGEPYVQRDHAAMDEATLYLVHEAEARPTIELLGLLSDAASHLLGGFCEGNPENLRRSGQLLDAADKVEDTFRGPNRFLDD